MSLLSHLLVLLEAEAGAAAQFALLLSEVLSPGCAGPRLQDVVDLEIIEQVTQVSEGDSERFTDP